MLDPDYPRPTLPNSDWCLIRVRAAGLNRAELRGRNNEPGAPAEFGKFADEWHPNPPKILGEDCVGEVDEAGATSGFKKGDRVTGLYYGGGKAYDGSYAQYTLIRKDLIYHLPGPDELEIGEGEGKLSWSVIGASTGTGWTAWGALFETGRTKDGDKVVIHGGTSSVGVWAIMLAKAHGCMVIATTRQQSKIEKLKAAGADVVVLEKEYSEMVKEVRAVAPDGVNTVIELVDPNSVLDFGLQVLDYFGTCVPCGVLSGNWKVKEFIFAALPHARYLTMHAGVIRDDNIPKAVREIVSGIREGRFKKEIFLNSVFPLEEVGQAHDLMEENKLTGRAVLRVD